MRPEVVKKRSEFSIQSQVMCQVPVKVFLELLHNWQWCAGLIKRLEAPVEKGADTVYVTDLDYVGPV
jgi:hypothetical protein